MPIVCFNSCFSQLQLQKGFLIIKIKGEILKLQYKQSGIFHGNYWTIINNNLLLTIACCFHSASSTFRLRMTSESILTSKIGSRANIMRMLMHMLMLMLYAIRKFDDFLQRWMLQMTTSLSYVSSTRLSVERKM